MYLHKDKSSYSAFIEIRAEDFNPLVRRMTANDKDQLVKKGLQRMYPKDFIQLPPTDQTTGRVWIVDGYSHTHIVVLDNTRTVNELRLNMIANKLDREYIPIISIGSDDPELNKDMYEETND